MDRLGLFYRFFYFLFVLGFELLEDRGGVVDVRRLKGDLFACREFGVFRVLRFFRDFGCFYIRTVRIAVFIGSYLKIVLVEFLDLEFLIYF